MIRATRALRQSVQNRLVSQYGKSEEYSPNGNWSTRDEWWGQKNNAPDASDRVAELNTFFGTKFDSKGEKIHHTAMDYYRRIYEKIKNKTVQIRCFREVGLFLLFIFWRLHRVQHIKEEIKDSPVHIGHDCKPVEKIHIDWWQVTGCL